MHTQRYRQLNICSAAGTGDENEIVAVFGFDEDLVHVGAEHFGVDDGEVNTRRKGLPVNSIFCKFYPPPRFSGELSDGEMDSFSLKFSHTEYWSPIAN